MDDDLATALAAERAIVRRGVEQTRAIDGGWVVGHPPLASVWHLNRAHLTVERPGCDAGALEALAARELADVPHHRVTLDDTRTADALWPALEARRWRRERSVVMVRGAPALGGDVPLGMAVEEPSGPPAVRAIAGPALTAFQELAFAADAAVTAISAALPARLADAQAVLRAGTEWRGLGAGASGEGLPACTATLYLDPDVGGRRVAFVDQVATLRPHRERGLARAVMGAALQAAGRWDADLIALFADAEDWPQVFYAGLGFLTVGRQTVFHREP